MRSRKDIIKGIELSALMQDALMFALRNEDKSLSLDDTRTYERQLIAIEDQFNELFPDKERMKPDQFKSMQDKLPHFEVPNRLVNRVFLHHLAADLRMNAEGIVKIVDGWHKQRGWRGIGYHFVIDYAGNIAEGRDIELTPAAQGGNNTGTIAIALSGGVNGRTDQFTVQQMQSLKDFCIHINDVFNRAGKQVTFHGHKEVSATLCPAYDYVKVLQLDTRGSMK